MTVYSNQKWANSQRGKINFNSTQELAREAGDFVHQNSQTFIINTFLLLALGALLLFYVGQINGATSNSYKIKLLNDKIGSLNEAHATLAAQKSSIEDASAIAQFAQANNMEEIKSPAVMFENNNVALQR